ncbi:hypothetical protein, partial [Lishizhenia sp.]|uniref:hypothetical protein n=1 Tax=Lishizhenia sp. TaxID=2497594 RepID=UPI00299E3D22
MKKQLLALSAGLMAVAGLRAQCSPISAPFIETFTGTSAPACWNTSYTAGDGWDFNPSSYNPGYEVQGTADHTNGAVGDDFAFIDFSSPTDVNVVLESPEIDVTGITTPTLRFYHISHCVNNFANLAQHNELNIEAWDGSAWVLVDLVQGENGANWTDYYYDLTAYVYNTNFIKFRFRGEVGQNTNYAYYNDLLLDDVEIFD